jgi:hypothetical protein
LEHLRRTSRALHQVIYVRRKSAQPRRSPKEFRGKSEKLQFKRFRGAVVRGAEAIGDPGWETEAKNERGRLCRHKRPKSREETPKEGIGDNIVAAPQ